MKITLKLSLKIESLWLPLPQCAPVEFNNTRENEEIEQNKPTYLSFKCSLCIWSIQYTWRRLAKWGDDACRQYGIVDFLFITLGRHSIDNGYANPFVFYIERLSFNTLSAQCSCELYFVPSDFYLATNDVNIVSNRFSFSFILCQRIRKLASSPKWAMKAFNFQCIPALSMSIGFDSTTTTTTTFKLWLCTEHIACCGVEKCYWRDVYTSNRMQTHRHILTGVSRTNTWICPCFCFVHNNRINW